MARLTWVFAVRPASSSAAWQWPAPPGRRRSTVALTAGAVGLVVGGFVVATADGGPGSGSGIVGGYAALGLGLIALVLGGLAQARSRRTA